MKEEKNKGIAVKDEKEMKFIYERYHNLASIEDEAKQLEFYIKYASRVFMLKNNIKLTKNPILDLLSKDGDRVNDYAFELLVTDKISILVGFSVRYYAESTEKRKKLLLNKIEELLFADTILAQLKLKKEPDFEEAERLAAKNIDVFLSASRNFKDDTYELISSKKTVH